MTKKLINKLTEHLKGLTEEALEKLTPKILKEAKIKAIDNSIRDAMDRDGIETDTDDQKDKKQALKDIISRLKLKVKDLSEDDIKSFMFCNA